MSNELFEKAKRIKGYGSFSPETKADEIEKIKILNDGSRIKIKVIESLSEYVTFVDTLKTHFENPVFFRGQINADYLLLPSSLRKNCVNEHRLIEAFSRYFYREVDECQNAMAKLVLMQHFGLATRCLDISENPLAALYFACVPYKKFANPYSEIEKQSWGEIVLFQEKETPEVRPERIKGIHSSNVSIIANTAFMNNNFNLWEIGSLWKKDANQTYNEKFINLKTLVRDSFIVRVPQNNPRIKNQSGAFILVNANTAFINNKEKRCSPKELTTLINSKEYITYQMLLTQGIYKNFLNEKKTWTLQFQKVKPYDGSNTLDFFKTDPFDIRKIFYTDDNKNQLVVLIPPKAKEKIKDELSRFNITEQFIYPDMDSVANEINLNINQ